MATLKCPECGSSGPFDTKSVNPAQGKSFTLVYCNKDGCGAVVGALPGGGVGGGSIPIIASPFPGLLLAWPSQFEVLPREVITDNINDYLKNLFPDEVPNATVRRGEVLARVAYLAVAREDVTSVDAAASELTDSQLNRLWAVLNILTGFFKRGGN